MMRKRLILFFLLIFHDSAYAHVKWFVNYNEIEKNFTLMGNISEGWFFALFILSIISIYLVFLLESKYFENANVDIMRNSIPNGDVIIRFGVALSFSLYFLEHYLNYITPDKSTITIAPELIVYSPYVFLFHLSIVILSLFKKTCHIAGLTLAALYLVSVDAFGWIHLLDYLVFIGLAVSLIFLSKGKLHFAIYVLKVATLYSFFIGGIEKFLYPQLYYPLLEEHDYITMGLDLDFFISASGFVELCLAFVIFFGAFSSIIATMVLITIIILGAFPFGYVDVIGHIPFALGLILFLRYPNKHKHKHKNKHNEITFKYVKYVIFYTFFFYVVYKLEDSTTLIQ